MDRNDEMFRCRKCRQVLFLKDNLIKTKPANEETTETHIVPRLCCKGCAKLHHESGVNDIDHNLLYLNPDHCPQWIQTATEKAGYRRAKLNCPQCHAKVGALNYLSPYRANISPIHILKCKIDMIPRLTTSETESNLERTRPKMSSSSEMGAGLGTSSLTGEDAKPAEMQQPHRRSLSTGALRPLLATASNLNPSLSLTNPLSLLSRSDPETSDCEQQTDEAGSSLLDNLFAIGQAAVEAANLSHGIDEYSDDEISEGASQHSENHGSRQDLPSVDSHQNDRAQATNELPSLPRHRSDSCEVAPDVLPDKTENYQLMCPVCLEHYYNPHKCLPCKHIFCDPCLRRLRKTDMNSPTKCPLCRVVIKKCAPHSGLSSTITSMFPESYRSRHKLEKKQKHKLPPLPGEPITIDNRFGPNMLATWSAVCGIVLLMMFVFCVFASLVGFILWYTIEVVLDVAGELLFEISDMFSFSWQALIILYLEGQMPHNIGEVLSGCAGRIFGTLSRLVDRTKIFFTEGEVAPPPTPVAFYFDDPHIQFGNHTQVLTKVAQANLVNYVFLAGLVTYLFYRIGRYLQNMNANQVQIR